MDDLIVARDEQLRISKLARIEVPFLQERIDAVEPRGVEAVLFGRFHQHRSSIPLFLISISIALSGARINSNVAINRWATTRRAKRAESMPRGKQCDQL